MGSPPSGLPLPEVSYLTATRMASQEAPGRDFEAQAEAPIEDALSPQVHPDWDPATVPATPRSADKTTSAARTIECVEQKNGCST